MMAASSDGPGSFGGFGQVSHDPGNQQPHSGPGRKGRPPLPAPAETDKAVSAVISLARRTARVSVRELLSRMEKPISAPAYARFEAGRRTVVPAVLQDVCRALGLDHQQVQREAAVAVSASAEDWRITDGVMLGANGPQVPAIRVRAHLLTTATDSWLDPVRGMLRLLAGRGTDEAGDLLLEEPLIRAIAHSCGMPVIDCWIRLTRWIVHDAAPASL